MSKFIELDIQKFASPFLINEEINYTWNEENIYASSAECRVWSDNDVIISTIYDSNRNNISAQWGAPGQSLSRTFEEPYQDTLTFISEDGAIYSKEIIIKNVFKSDKKSIKINKDFTIENSKCKLSDVAYYTENFLDLIHPVGSVVKTTTSYCPFEKGRWNLKTSGPDIKKVGSQVLYSGASGSGTVSKTSVYGSYDYELIDGIFSNITIPSGYHKEYRLTFYGTTGGRNRIICYINNIATNEVRTWSGDTYRNIGASNYFKESDIILEPTKEYEVWEGTNLYYEVKDSSSWIFTDVTIHGYLVSDDTYYYWERIL